MRLSAVARSIKSANAGASQLTFEVTFSDAETYDAVAASGALNEAAFAERYAVPADAVALYWFRPTMTLKATIPRRTFEHQLDETDFDGTQQYAPLLDLEVPLEP